MSEPDDRDRAFEQGQDAWEGALREAIASASEPRTRCVRIEVQHLRLTASRRAPHAFECRVLITWRDTQTAREAAVAYHGGTDWPVAMPAVSGDAAVDWIEPSLGPRVLRLAAVRAALWACPNDPALPQLPRLMRPEGAAAILPAGQRGLGVASVQVLSHAARRHAVLRVQLQASPGADPVRLVAKTFADDKALQVHARATAFWQLHQRDPTAPRVAQPLGLDLATRTVWYAWVEGVPLADLLDGPLALPALAAAARTLARIHDVPLLGERVRDLDFNLAEVERRRRKLSRLWPASAARVDRLAASLQAHAPRLPTPQRSVIHGDCQPTQFLLADGAATVLDLDSLATGMPMEDLAEFIVKLRGLALPRAETDLRVETFVRAYVMAAPMRFEASWLHWHVAVQALLAACRLAQSGRRDWQAQAIGLLEQAERGLSHLTPLESCIG